MWKSNLEVAWESNSLHSINVVEREQIYDLIYNTLDYCLS